jgi:3-deoxy-7-phosphoheptulonate synthase
MLFKTDDVRISGIQEVSTPAEVHAEFPIDDTASETVFHHRAAVHKILHGEDDRLVVIVGPCSIHNVDAARDYAQRLKPLIDELADDLCIIMRVYFEKPRTTVGWKGLINDPDMDESFHINKGLRLARSLLLDLNKEGVPAATEFLDRSTLLTWSAGALSAHGPPKARATANSPPASPAPSASKTVPTAALRSPSTPCRPPRVRTCSCR